MVAELDVPGEYFADRSEGTLYWKPPSLSQLLGASRLEASQAAGAAGVVSLLPHVVSIVNASDITFSGIALLHARGNGVDAVHSRGLALSDCVLANHGNLAVNFTNCTHSEVTDCNISDTGDGGGKTSTERFYVQTAHYYL